MRIAMMLGALLGSGMAVPAVAATTVLDFAGAICGPAGGIDCLNNVQIVGNYGSTGDVSVQWSTRLAPGNSAVIDPFVRYWNANYADLVGVAYATGPVGYAGEAAFTVAPGKSLTLDRVDVAGWPSTDRESSVRIYDLAWNLLFDTGTIVFPGSTALTINLGVSSSTGLILQWGPDAFNGGIDNLTFTVRGSAPPPIPEPATWAMLIAGFGLVGASLRRSRALSAA